MKTSKFPRPVKESLYAFLIFLVIVIFARHVMNDQRQEARIEALEIELAQLEARQESISNKWLQQQHTTAIAAVSDDTHHTKRQTYKTPDIQTSTKTTASPTSAPTSASTNTATTVETSASEDEQGAVETLIEKLTEPNGTRKFQTPVCLELNTVDSATLVRVPGIAAKTAATILSYRSRLGGFYSPDQLRERLTWESASRYMDEWCSVWFKADASLVQMLHINSLSFKEINKHPYISYEQTKALVNYRDKHKGIRSMEEIKKLKEFDQETIEKISHYLCFD